MTTIIFITLASIVILGGTAGYYVFAKHRKAKIIAASLAAAAASTISASTTPLPEAFVAPETPISPPPATPIIPVAAASNVTVSSVEEIHSEPLSAPVPMTATSQGENESKSAAFEQKIPENVAPETVIAVQENTVPPILPVDNQNIQLSTEQDVPSLAPALSPETISVTKESSIDEQEKILEIASQPESSSPIVSEPVTPPAAPLVEMPISDLFTTAPQPAVSDNTPAQNTETATISTPHPLFDSIFDSVPPKANI